MSNVNWSDPAIIAAIISGAFAIASGFITLCVYNRKKKLEAKLNSELEIHKANLSRTSNELQEKLRIEYGSLYAKRVYAIEEMYNILVKIYDIQNEIGDQINRFHAEEGYKGQKHLLNSIASLVKLLSDFERLYSKSKIYFSKDDSNKISKIINTSDDFIRNYNSFMENEYGYNDYIIEDFVTKHFTILYREYNITLLILENRFRELIGVNTTMK